jgi:hypothetical protein
MQDKDYMMNAGVAWAFETIKRGSIFLDTDKNNPLVAFESLSDYYDWVVAPLQKKRNEYSKRIDEIDKLVYGKEHNPNIKKQNLEEAHKLMKKLFRDFNCDLWNKNIFIPRTTKAIATIIPQSKKNPDAIEWEE